jgi:hypothetical protein
LELLALLTCRPEKDGAIPMVEAVTGGEVRAALC